MTGASGTRGGEKRGNREKQSPDVRKKLGEAIGRWKKGWCFPEDRISGAGTGKGSETLHIQKRDQMPLLAEQSTEKNGTCSRQGKHLVTEMRKSQTQEKKGEILPRKLDAGGSLKYKRVPQERTTGR